MGFEQDNFVYLLEVVDLLNLPIMRLPINDFLRLLIHHVYLSGILSVLFDFMFDQIWSQVGKLNGWSVGLVRSVEKIDELLNVVFSAGHRTITDNFTHDVDELL